jgi:hypothetical protein
MGDPGCSNLAEDPTLPTCIWEGALSNLGQYTARPDWGVFVVVIIPPRGVRVMP